MGQKDISSGGEEEGLSMLGSLRLLKLILPKFLDESSIHRESQLLARVSDFVFVVFRFFLALRLMRLRLPRVVLNRRTDVMGAFGMHRLPRRPRGPLV